MPNHFHFLIKIKEYFKSENVKSKSKSTLEPIEKAFRDFFIVYAKAFNNMYSRTGSLFQYKFKRKVITDNNYFIRVIAYIHNNPVRNRLCEKVSDWKYSSYSAIISNKSTSVKREDVLEFFENCKKEFEEFHKFYSTLIEDRDFLFKREYK